MADYIERLKAGMTPEQLAAFEADEHRPRVTATTSRTRRSRRAGRVPRPSGARFGMAWDGMASAMARDGISAEQSRYWFELYASCDMRDEDRVTLSQVEMAERFGVKVRTIERAYAALRDKDYLEWVSHGVWRVAWPETH